MSCVFAVKIFFVFFRLNLSILFKQSYIAIMSYSYCLDSIFSFICNPNATSLKLSLDFFGICDTILKFSLNLLFFGLFITLTNLVYVSHSGFAFSFVACRLLRHSESTKGSMYDRYLT